MRCIPRLHRKGPLRRRHCLAEKPNRIRGRGCGQAGCRPVVPSECERGEVDFMRKLEEAAQCGGPWIEGCRPGNDMRDVFETACQRIQQLLLQS